MAWCLLYVFGMPTRPAAPSDKAPVETLSFKAPKAPSFTAWELALAELGEKSTKGE